MGVGAESSEWVLTFSLLAKCRAGATDISFLPGHLLLLLLLCSVVAVLHWSSPGGPAWGKYWWSTTIFSGEDVIPGPRGFPIIGSMGLMNGLAHRKLAAAADRHSAWRLMALSVGESRVVVSSHPDVAKEILNSAAFSDRPVKESAYGLMFHRAIGFAPYGLYWRTLRRISSAHLFSPKQISNSAAKREHIASQMMQTFTGYGGREVRVRDVLKPASLNNIMWLVFGRRYDLSGGGNGGGTVQDELKELCFLVEEGYDLLGTLNWSDHLPFLAGLDLQGIRARCSILVPRVKRFVSRIVDEHRARPGRAEGDFVDVMISLQGVEKLTDPDITAVLWEMIFRGTDTVAVLMEWALARLVLHRDVQSRLHHELDQVVGFSRAVTQSDVASLPYLQAVIKETLRMHPPGPLLSWARLAAADTLVDGRLIPAGTTAMVNMWAISHDPKVWDSPLEFRPERFLDAAVDVAVLGADLRLAPFGSGRRSCPGKALGLATVTFWMAAILHEFRLELPADGTRVDLSEVLRLSCEMAVPLTVKLHKRRTSPSQASVQ